MKRLTFILLLVVTSIILIGCQKDNRQEQLVVGMEVNYAPYNWGISTQDESTHPVSGIPGQYATGYDVFIAKEIAKKLNLELIIKKMDFNGLIPAVQSGDIDLIIAGMTPTDERAMQVNFTEPYYESLPVVVVSKDSKFANAKTLEDLRGARLDSQIGTIYDTYAKQVPEVVLSSPLSDDYPAMLRKLQAGDIDGYVVETPVGLSVINKNENTKLLNIDFTTTKQEVAISVGIKKGRDELLKKINDALSTITKEKRAEIMEQMVKNS